MTGETHCLSTVMPTTNLSIVMPGFMPGIHVLKTSSTNTWMAGTSPAMTKGGFMPGDDE
jgi:hypothetical protein